MLKTLTILGAIALTGSALAAGDVERGAYLARIMDCGGCHSGRLPDGAPDPSRYLAGSTLGFELPGWGIYWPPNLTPHETGLAGWSEDDIVRAVRTGERPDGRLLAPIMPWPSFAWLTEEDAHDLAAFLMSLPPVENVVPASVRSPDEAKATYYGIVRP